VRKHERECTMSENGKLYGDAKMRSSRPSTSVVFQSASAWNEKGLTGSMAMGIFKGSRPNQNFPEKLDYIFEMCEAGQTVNKSGEIVDYPAGSTVIINGSGNLALQLEDVSASEGDLVEIKYRGTRLIKKGRYKDKPSHQFEALVEDLGEASNG